MLWNLPEQSSADPKVGTQPPLQEPLTVDQQQGRPSDRKANQQARAANEGPANPSPISPLACLGERRPKGLRHDHERADRRNTDPHSYRHTSRSLRSEKRKSQDVVEQKKERPEARQSQDKVQNMTSHLSHGCPRHRERIRSEFRMTQKKMNQTPDLSQHQTRVNHRHIHSHVSGERGRRNQPSSGQ